MTSGPEVLWTPSSQQVEQSAMARFQEFATARSGRSFADYESLWQWSTTPGSTFWALLAEFFGVLGEGDWSLERDRNDLSGVGWFPGVRLNYAAQVLADRGQSGPALIAVSEGRDDEEISWPELRRRVGSLSAKLREWGIEPGDRMAAYMPSIAETVIALLATASVGAVWACCAPDYGTEAVVDRLAQIEPKVLVVADGYRFAGKDVDRTAAIGEIVDSLPTLKRVITVSRIGAPIGAGSTPWAEVVAGDVEPVFEPVAFDQPLWILYSSGTTGLPKGIMHSHGGIVLEHIKWLGIHDDVRAGDRFFWFSSTAWIVWNVGVSSLLLGATCVLYDGAPNRPDAGRLWEVVADTRITHFGTSAGYLTASEKAGVRPGDEVNLTDLRAVIYSGSVLPLEGWRWIYDAVKSDVWLDAPCGGTDVCTAYVGGNPTAPVVAGEMQCRFLGTRVESWDADGRAHRDQMGELVVTAAMPSMPVGFWNDPDGTRYLDTYFSDFPGTWRHGDWITITERGTAIVHGRSDSTINRHGVRFGSADIYAAIEPIPEILDSLVVGAEMGQGAYWMPLFVVLGDGAALDAALVQRINTAIRTAYSARHVPDEIIQAPAIPHTLTGKRLEVPIKRLIQGQVMSTAVNRGVVDVPEVLTWFAELGETRRLQSETTTAPGTQTTNDRARLGVLP